MSGHDTSSTTGPRAGRTERGDPTGSFASKNVAADLATAKHEIARLRRALADVEERERTLADELHHRVRNVLAMIRSISRQSWEEGTSQEQYAQHLQGRLDAVARYQSRFGSHRMVAFELEDMLRDELLQTRCLDEPRCVLSGPAVSLRGREAELVGLVLHELTTNAIKFGAFAGTGSLSVLWSVHGGRLDLRWTEAGVAIASSAPRATGFGRRLIEAGLPYELGAVTAWDLRPGGLVCILVLTLPDAQPGLAEEGSALAPRPTDLLE